MALSASEPSHTPDTDLIFDLRVHDLAVCDEDGYYSAAEVEELLERAANRLEELIGQKVFIQNGGGFANVFTTPTSYTYYNITSNGRV